MKVKSKRVAKQSVREYPWLVKTRGKAEMLISGHRKQDGAAFRLYGETGKAPSTAAVFLCSRCGTYGIATFGNVKAWPSCCGKSDHGFATSEHSETYAAWKYLQYRSDNGQDVQAEWLHPTRGILHFVIDAGQRPSKSHYLVKVVAAKGWTRGNVRWERDRPGVTRIEADDTWRLVSGGLKQVGRTLRCDQSAVFRCRKCKGYSVESRDQVRAQGWTCCQKCRDRAPVYEYGGRQMRLYEIAEATGMDYHLLADRIVRYGWSVDRAVSQPVRSSDAKADA